MSEVGSGAVGAEQAFRGALPAGTRLRSYELVAVLGQGAFGITYLARDVTLGRQVAIKEYLPTSVAFRDGDVRVVARSAALADEFVWGRERFLDEARTLATLEGTPAVVRVIDYLEANGTAYTVMVLAPGETLDWRLRAGTLPAMAIDALLEPLLIGLEQVHALGFLHRDIKPANIIVDGRFHPTLIDFGAARAAMVGRSTALTAIFTPGYAAVEQFTASHQGPWTDIYGLAATLHHAIIGRPPPSAIDRMLDDSYEPLSRLSLAGFSPALLAAIDSGLRCERRIGRNQSSNGVPSCRAPACATMYRQSFLPRASRRRSRRDACPCTRGRCPAGCSKEAPQPMVGGRSRCRLAPGRGYLFGTRAQIDALDSGFAASEG